MMKYRFILFSAILAICHIGTTAEYIIPEGSATASNGTEGFGLLNTLSQDDSSAVDNILANTVDLYSGQYAESFPLASLSGRGGLGYDLVLKYNSNVSHTAKSENYKAQASPFGLGFSIDRHSIIVDHKSTTMLEDDKYRLQSGGGSTELIQAEGNRFITKNGDPWVITRHLDTVDNTPIIIGWTILKEDGTVYQYGDMTDNFTCPVATRLIHHYGTYVGNGVTNDDQPYPYQWDLRKISDPEGLNWIEFYYLTDNAHLRVRDTASGSLVYSGYPYTRGSYLFEILMADSNSVRIIYEDRNDDLQSFYGVNNYEFLYTKRASHVIRLKPRYDTLIRYCDTLYTTKFLYEYLNDENSPSLNKLALKQINTYSKEESEELPPTSFIYHVEKDDCEYGRIHKVCYPFGALKEIFYRAVADSVNVSLLDTALVENQTWNLFKPGGSTLYSNSNMFFHYSNVPVYGCWDGYWHIDTANIDTSKYDVHEWDEPAVSNEDWIAYYDRGEEEIIVKRWMGGYWRTDTLVGSIVRNSGDNVYMSAGTDCFVVAVGPYGQAANTPSEWTRFLHRAYYYYWNGNYWVQYQIFDPSGVDPDTYKLSAVKVNVNTYGIYCWDYKYYSAGSDNNHYRDTVIFGKYNYSTDSIASYSQPWGWCGGYDGGRVRMVVGPDMVAFTHSAYTIYDNPYIYYIIHSYNTVAYRWVDDNWSFTVFSWYDEDPDMKTRRLALLSNGFINAFLGQSEFISVFRDGDSFKTISNPGNGSYSRMWTSGHSLIIEGAGADHEIRIYEWDGIDWDYDHLFNWYFGSGEPVRDVQLFQNSYAYGPGVTLRRYMGNQTWEEDSIAEFVAENNPYDWQGCRASSFYLARRAEYGLDPGDDTNYVYLYNKYYDDNYKRSVLNAPTWEQGGSNNSSGFYPHEEFLYQVDMFNYTGYYKNDIYGYRYFDRQFKGKPLYVIVDSIVLLNFEEDENPTIQKFNFFAGMLASDGLTPRFAKAEVSTPYTANDDGPDGYTKFYFYNDIDSAGFYDAAVYDSSLTDSMYFPDMDNGTMYRVANGGYHLDGRIYYTESYSVDSEQTANFPTYTYNYYSLHNVPDSELVIDVYRIHLDSTKLEKGNFYFWTNYEYDTYSGQITRKRSSHFPASTYMVEDYVYAHADSTGDNLLTARAMLADNAINRIKIDSTYYDSLGTCRLLSKSGRNYDLNGGWESVQHYSWRDLNDQTEILVTDSAYAFDDFGNLLGRINANGVVSASKYDNRGLKIIGEASNCRPEEFLVQDFEQIPLDYTAGSGWDGWHLWNDEYGNGHLDTTDAFTGKACFTIKNDDASDQINENNWGPGRTIMAS
ncbi:MAG: hypothetical protein GY841_14675, partial [FCB group bacterium]|nr:hypothetical protein [FCB group bacterium]